MFGLKKKTPAPNIQTDISDQAVDAFEKANKGFLNSIEMAKQLSITINQIDADVIQHTQTINALVAIVQTMDLRIKALENQLNIDLKKVKFSD